MSLQSHLLIFNLIKIKINYLYFLINAFKDVFFILAVKIQKYQNINFS